MEKLNVTRVPKSGQEETRRSGSGLRTGKRFVVSVTRPTKDDEQKADYGRFNVNRVANEASASKNMIPADVADRDLLIF